MDGGWKKQKQHVHTKIWRFLGWFLSNFLQAPFQSRCLGVALCSLGGGQRSGQNLGEEVEWRKAMELPASHTAFLTACAPAGASARCGTCPTHFGCCAPPSNMSPLISYALFMKMDGSRYFLFARDLYAILYTVLIRGGLFRQIRIFFEHCSKGGGSQTHVNKICCKFCMILKAFWQHKIDIKRLFKGRNVSIWG